MNNNRINIIKHVEAQEGKDIFQDFEEIRFILDGQKYSHKPLYCFKKRFGCGFADVFLELVHNKFMRNINQIANRIQYIKQSGYKFKEYFINENSLTIVFE